MKGMNKKKNNSRMGQLQSGENRRWALMDGLAKLEVQWALSKSSILSSTLHILVCVIIVYGK